MQSAWCVYVVRVLRDAGACASSWCLMPGLRTFLLARQPDCPLPHSSSLVFFGSNDDHARMNDVCIFDTGAAVPQEAPQA